MIQTFTIENIFSKDSINIFTDASIYNLKTGGKIQDTISCPGFVITNQMNIIDKGCNILHHSTSNKGELTALYMGVIEASKYIKQFKHVRIFSDSQLSVFAIRDRFFNWCHFTDEDGNLYGYDKKKPIDNLSYILQIVYFILENNLDIEIYHQKGHVQDMSISSLLYAMSTFEKSNSQFIDMDFIRKNPDRFSNFVSIISKFNNEVDNYTRTMLHSLLEKNENIINPISYVYRKDLFDYNKYLHLLNKV